MRALILAYEFPPFTSIAVQRPYSWFRYFPESGIHSTVITRQWAANDFSQESFILPSQSDQVLQDHLPEGEVIRAPFKPNLRDRFLLRFGYSRWSLIRKFLTMIYLASEHYSDAMDRDLPIYLAARDYLSRNKADVIIATGGPFILFRYARRLSAEFGIPWAADYRDGWYTHENFEVNDPVTRWIFRNFLICKEKEYVKSASLVTVASPSYIKKLSALHPEARFETVYNGFISEKFNGLDQISQPQQEFTITYAGTVYEFQRLDVFVNGFRQFLQEHPNAKVRVIFYGTRYYPKQFERVKKETAPIADYVQITERMPHEDVLRHMRSSHVLLLLANQNNCLLASKIYDYLAVGRQILLCENDHGVLEEIIAKTRSGFCASDASDTAAQLSKWYSEFLQTGAVQGTTANIGFYDRRNQAGIYAALLRQHCLKSSESKQPV